ncbi:flavin reductase family protein [Streptomyces labedae]|uniref:Flavin reductase family protein n=1 Tax=Streptomyces labedae TaxID=285569 RepID=A0ABP6QNG3_9ACTN
MSVSGFLTVPAAPCAQREPGPGAVTAQAFKDLFAQVPTGVTVITTSDTDGTALAGMTASAVCSLSLDPPLLLVCAANHSRTLAAIRSRGAFAVNILAQEQVQLAQRFADPGLTQADRFAGTSHQRADGLPVLDEALAWLTCRVEHAYPGGDHTILTAAVHSLQHHGGQPLIWHQRTFRSLA